MAGGILITVQSSKKAVASLPSASSFTPAVQSHTTLLVTLTTKFPASQRPSCNFLHSPNTMVHPTSPSTLSAKPTLIQTSPLFAAFAAIAQTLWWISSTFKKWATRLVLAILVSGPIPQHVAFVMDGNRRYARNKKKQVQEGHTDGFYALHHILDICLQLHIKCVSVYAFSIENFKRPEEEVQALMSLAKQKLTEITEQGELLDRYGVRVNILGRTELLPPDVQQAVQRAESRTRHNNSAILNICMPYTSRDEMASAVNATAKYFKSGDSCPEDISEIEIEKRLYSTMAASPPVDVLVRTSGTNRLSDYFLWQSCEDVQIHFTSSLWPDFGLRDLVPIILSYQRKVWAGR